MKTGQDRMEKLDRLLADALSPKAEAPPVALDLERARLRIVRANILRDRQIEKRFTLIGFAASVIELAFLLLVLSNFQLGGIPLLTAVFGLFQAVGLLTCSLGSRTALKCIRTQFI